MRGWLRPELIFVYGSLRADGRRVHPLLMPARALGRARVRGRRVPAGPWPGAVPDADDWIQGELYRLLRARASLWRLDAYEGCRPGAPHCGRYRRARVRVTTARGPVLAWIYWFGRARRMRKATPTPGTAPGLCSVSSTSFKPE